MIMTVKLLVRVETRYNQTNFKQLLELGTHYWDKNKHCAVWTFPLHNLKRAIALLGHTIQIDKKDIETLANYSPPIGTEHTLEPYKCKGFVEIVKTPKLYVIKTIINKEEKKFFVPVENVEAAVKIILDYPKYRKIKSSTIAERIIHYLGIIRFDRTGSGSFDWPKFFGNRKVYYNYFYLPMKVLEAKYFIKHHKKGWIERVKDDFKENKIIVSSG